MVQSLIKSGKTVFKCEDCGLLYRDELTARKCEEFCSTHNACSIEITKQAINKDATDA
jgi:uncharacterized Zn finger protein